MAKGFIAVTIGFEYGSQLPVDMQNRDAEQAMPLESV
jgi:hypothetical protein